MNELVTVIIPIYNTEKYLEYAIESAINQTYTNIEILLINDGSKDNSSEACLKFLNDRRVKYQEHENRGPSFTRNEGIRNCRGDFVAFLDSDDIWKVNKLEKQMFLFNNNPQLDVVYSKMEIIDTNGIKLSDCNIPLYSGYVINKMYVDNFVCMSSAVVRKKIFSETGLLDENIKMSEDYELWLRIALKHKFNYVNESLVLYRQHESQASNRRLERIEAVKNIYDNFDKNYPNSINLIARQRAKASSMLARAYYYNSISDRNNEIKSYLRSLSYYPFNVDAISGTINTISKWLLNN